ncbi:MAG TPA: hypothetical protein VFA11_09690 [Acidimicrobiales bacterium]|nr:hypothetical protein [Acidimicrobiales bacterium]
MLGRSLRTRAATGAALVALVVLVATFFVHPGPSGNLLDPGTGPHVLNADPGVVLTHPSDPRVQGLYFTGQITGSGLFSAIGSGSDRVVAPSGDLIAVVEFAGTLDSNALAAALDNSGPRLSAAMVVAGRSWPLDLSSWITSASFMWAQAVPKGAPVLFQLNDGGALTDYSVNYARLVAPVPAVSYRSSSSAVVDAAPVTSATAPASVADPTDPSFDNPSASATFQIDGAQLAWYGPHAPSEHPGPGQAFLLLRCRVYGPSDYGIQVTWPADRLQLLVPGHQPIGAGHVDNWWMGVAQDVYYWTVPADLRHAQVRFEPASFGPDQTGGWNLHMTAPATLSLDFPASGAPPPSIDAQAAAHPPVPGGSDLVWLLRFALLVGFLVAGTLAFASERADIARPVRVFVIVEGEEGAKLVPTGEPPQPEAPVVAEVPVDVVDLREPDAVVTAPTGAEEDGTAPDLAEGPDGAALYLMRTGVGAVGRLGDLDERHLRVLVIIALAGGGDRPLDEELIRSLYGTDLKEPGTKTIENYISDLRSLLPPGAIPRFDKKAGYRLTDALRVDVVEFDRVLKRASGLAGAPRAELLAEALDLVRGVPLVAFGTWNFAVEERNRLDAVIERTAAELAAWRRADKDLAGADRALRAGLRGYKLSIQLWDERLRIAKAGGPVPYEQVRSAARAALGELFGLLEEAGPARPEEPA